MEGFVGFVGRGWIGNVKRYMGVGRTLRHKGERKWRRIKVKGNGNET